MDRRRDACVGARLEDISPRGRVAGPAKGIALDELALAARDHGLPLEALRHAVTPRGGRGRAGRGEYGRGPLVGRGRTRPAGRERLGPRRRRTSWAAEPGRPVLSARATGAAGRTQPVEQPWNRGGFGNNLVQRVPVVCVPGT
ncbi:hypothetical protein [Streptomyces chryseus]